ncbi:MAG: phosphate ABC transporter permease PstA [Candidatus Methanomethylophilus sp.]|nr:phosphate ABC transporter permease PstA [Methanomethylophilus sp.]
MFATGQQALGKRRSADSDRIIGWVLAAVASLAVLTLVFIILFIAENSGKVIGEEGLWSFITGGIWRPYQSEYGASSLITGTLLVTAGAVLFAFPLGLGLAVYLSEMAPVKVRRFLKPAVELFAGIPSVVYGFLGLILLVPMLANLFSGQTTSGFCWLAGSMLLGVMALPEIVSVSDDALRSVPNTYREASLGLGATKWETVKKVIVPAAAPGIAAAAILGIGRAIGETMAVMMVTGNTALLPEPLWNIFATVRTLTATIAMEMPECVVGSTGYSALFLLALILMVIILLINLAARALVARSQRRFTGTPAGRFEVWYEKRTAQFMEVCGRHRLQLLRQALKTALVFVFLFFIASLFVPFGEAVVLAAIVTAALGLLLTDGVRRLGRRRVQTAAHCGLAAIAVFVMLLLAVIIGYVVINGAPALSWSFLTEFPRAGGTAGGIYPAIVGTLELLAGTALIALPVGVLAGTYLAEYAGDGKISRLIRDAVDVLNGTPSVVFGLFGLAALVTWLGLGISLLAGCVTLALMVLPVIIRTTQEAVRQVPPELREASRALGATKAQTVFHVVLPAALSGIVTGAVLSLGRAAGETAPIMFTATVVIESKLGNSILDPVMALPYHLYYLASEGRADPSMMYGTALVLLIIVLGMFAVATAIRIRSERRSR